MKASNVKKITRIKCEENSTRLNAFFFLIVQVSVSLKTRQNILGIQNSKSVEAKVIKKFKLHMYGVTVLLQQNFSGYIQLT